MERVTRSKVIKLYKVIWNNHSEQDATWKREDYLREVSLLGTSPVVTPILGCNMTILVAIQISCIYIWSIIGGCIWNGAIGSCILLDVVLQYHGFAMHRKN